MGEERGQSQTFAEMVGSLPPPVGELDPDAGVWPSPIRDGEWFDGTGGRWHLLVPGLDLRQGRRLLTRPGARALHCYGMHPKEISGAELEALLARVDDFLRGRAPQGSEFWLAEFRNDSPRPPLGALQDLGARVPVDQAVQDARVAFEVQRAGSNAAVHGQDQPGCRTSS